MADRVAAARIIHGDGDNRITIDAGERVDTDMLGLSDADVRTLEERGVLRRVRDENTQAALPGGPQEPVTEDRSGKAANARSPDTQTDAETGDEADKPRGRTRRDKSADIDL